MRSLPAAILPFFAVLAASCDSTPPVAPTDKPAAASPAGESAASTTPPPAAAMNFHSLQTTTLDGAPADLSAYRGKVALVVNVASACGYTPQYKGLQALHTELKDQGFAVLGFPSNDFGAQEPGTPAEIRAFCTEKYAVDFPLFGKCQTKAGPGQSPVYAHLGAAAGGKLPNWNFCKYVVGKDGKVVAFFDSKTRPDAKELRAAIEQAMR